MRTITLGELKQKSRERADMVNSQFVKNSELVGLINDSITDLYDLLVDTYEDYYIKEQSLTTVFGQDTYSLPDDFYKMRGVDYFLSPTEFLSVRPFQFTERNIFNRSLVYESSYNAESRLRYRIVGNNIKFIPVPDVQKEIKFWYVPVSENLIDDIDTFDGINGYEELVIVDVAIKMLAKEESDTTQLERRYARLWKRVTDSAANRDAGESSRVSDVGNRSLRFYGYL